jgi:hypothetical protein
MCDPTIHIGIFKAETNFRKETCRIAINLAFPELWWLWSPLTCPGYPADRQCFRKLKEEATMTF